MAVFTHLTKYQIEDFLAHHDVGQLISFEGIAEGVDNTNYKIETTLRKYILTIFENRIKPDDLPFFLGFMNHLSKNGITCPSSVTGIDIIESKPAALFTFLDGRTIKSDDITPSLCYELGGILGKMHLSGQTCPLIHANSMGIDAWDSRLKKVGSQAQPYFAEIDFLKENWPQDLPMGAVHADLFPDNVFIKDGHIHGVIDFYFSATDYLAYDLAIVMNAWCFDMNNNFIRDRWDKLLAAYQSIRPLTQEEKMAYPVLCRGASMRFLSSRLHDFVFHDTNALVTPKPPTEYTEKLDFHRHDHTFF